MRTRILPLATAVAALCAAGCVGPRPEVTRQDLVAPSSPGGDWKLTVTVVNRGRGDGEAEVTARLLDADKRTAAQAHETVDLKGHESVPVTLTLHPAGDGPFQPEVEVQYPPE